MPDLFPYSTVRESQDLLIKDIETALKEKKILLAHAPTGLGKTASVLSVALKQVLESKQKIFFLTNRHTQHHIALETLKAISKKHQLEIPCADLIGKRWMCNQKIAGLFGNDFNEFCKQAVEKGQCEFYYKARDKNHLTVEAKLLLKEVQSRGPLHNEELMHLCREEGMCSYEIALSLAQKAKVIITDYNYLFSPFIQNNFLGKLDLKIEDIIVIVDEGHNLPSRVTEMLSSSLSSFTLHNAELEAKKYHYQGLIPWLEGLNKVLVNLAQFEEEKEKLVSKKQFLEQVNRFVNYENFIEELEAAAEEVRKKQQKSFLGGVASFLQEWKGEDQGFVRYIAEKKSKYGPMLSLNYACLDPSLITRNIFAQVHSGVIMSGTLNPTFMYKDVLGIERSLEKKYSSPFPIENRLSLVIPETTTKFTARSEQMYQEIGQKCAELAQLIPGNVAFFFPSYELRDQIGAFLQFKEKVNKKLFWEKSEMNKEEKELLINQFKAEKEKGGVLLAVAGANFAEGIDLPGELLQGVVIVGLPLARPDLITKEIINYFESKFARGWDYGYIYPAMNKCLQSAGRCIRSEKDRGAIIYLDQRFTWPRYYSCLPREGLMVSRNYAQLLKEFFKR